MENVDTKLFVDDSGLNSTNTNNLVGEVSDKEFDKEMVGDKMKGSIIGGTITLHNDQMKPTTFGKFK